MAMGSVLPALLGPLISELDGLTGQELQDKAQELVILYARSKAGDGQICEAPVDTSTMLDEAVQQNEGVE